MRKLSGILVGITGILTLIVGIAKKLLRSGFSISLSESSDGPTTVFFAGKLGTDYTNVIILLGIVCIIVSGIILFIKKR